MAERKFCTLLLIFLTTSFLFFFLNTVQLLHSSPVQGLHFSITFLALLYNTFCTFKVQVLHFRNLKVVLYTKGFSRLTQGMSLLLCVALHQQKYTRFASLKAHLNLQMRQQTAEATAEVGIYDSSSLLLTFLCTVFCLLFLSSLPSLQRKF